MLTRLLRGPYLDQRTPMVQLAWLYTLCKRKAKNRRTGRFVQPPFFIFIIIIKSWQFSWRPVFQY
uniref:Uncharacterized protein n=1 Tax=Amphimedon queenslandica TaxID=400682 RepID=A0A1X7SE22_AMPQE